MFNLTKYKYRNNKLYRQKYKLHKKHILTVKPNTVDKDDFLVLQAFYTNMAETNQIRKSKNLPLAKYDINRKLAYLEYPNGEIVYYYPNA